VIDIQIPVARPLGPDMHAVSPYLRHIDNNRYYSNFGPLCRQFEERLAAIYGLAPANLTTTANCTLGLAAALLALAKRGGRCMLPSWTFCASAHAVRLAGLQPFFLDVERDGWQMTPRLVEDAIAKFGVPAAVMPVAPFGAWIDTSEWDRFSARTGIPVVIDAASAFVTIEPGASACVVSLHATKVLGVGEGGFIASTDPDIVQRIRQVSNFGFYGARVAERDGMNAKISEYNAAVGLAALDTWPTVREQWCSVLDAYRSRLRRFRNIVRLPFSPNAVSSTLVPEFSVPIDQLADFLTENGIGCRRWWGRGCHREPIFLDCERTGLPSTELIADSCLGIPLYVDMTIDEIEIVVDTLERGFGKLLV
jgi:dTDP-4-amino-4,6-dideoxygalactose transaminase